MRLSSAFSEVGLSFRTATKGAGFLGCSIGCGVGIVLSFVRRWRPLHSSPARIAVALGMQELRVPFAARPFFNLSNSKFSITWCLCSFSLHFLNDVFFFSDILDMCFQTSNFPPLHLFLVYFSTRSNTHFLLRKIWGASLRSGGDFSGGNLGAS